MPFAVRAFISAFVDFGKENTTLPEWVVNDTDPTDGIFLHATCIDPACVVAFILFTACDTCMFPWLASEPHIVLTDTVEARARWDIEGIEVVECEPCPEELSPSADTSAVDSAASDPNPKSEAPNPKQR